MSACFYPQPARHPLIRDVLFSDLCLNLLTKQVSATPSGQVASGQ